MLNISDALKKVQIRQKNSVEDNSLQVALEGGKKAVLQGSMNVLLVSGNIWDVCSFSVCYQFSMHNLVMHVEFKFIYLVHVPHFTDDVGSFSDAYHSNPRLYTCLVWRV